jgi:hypothetical protein
VPTTLLDGLPFADSILRTSLYFEPSPPADIQFDGGDDGSGGAGDGGGGGAGGDSGVDLQNDVRVMKRWSQRRDDAELQDERVVDWTIKADDGGGDGGGDDDGDDGFGSGSGFSGSGGIVDSHMLLLAEQMFDAVEADDVSPWDMMVELRIALNDRCRWELGKFHCIDLRSQMLFRQGHWLYQCPSHKYKRVVRQLATFLHDETEEVQGRFSMRRLLRVNRELAAKASTPTEHAQLAAIDSVLTGGTDMHSQAAHIYVLLCPLLLQELEKRPECNPEYVTLKVLGMAWMGWDMSHLTELERIRRIELVEALYIYNVGGEQLYLPFYDETSKKHKGSKGLLVGILSQHTGIFSTQNLCALLQNGAVHRQFRQQFPQEVYNERAAPNNELENFFSQIAIHGYKPRLMELQARMFKIDAAMRILNDPLRRFYIKLSRKKQYDPVEFMLMNVIHRWNNGEALDEFSKMFLAWMGLVEKRAIAASRGKMSTIRQMNVVHSNKLRGTIRNVTGQGA